MAKKLILFRHGQTDWNIEGRIQGHIDIPFNQTGKDQALQLAEHIKKQNLEIIISSDLLRAHETATIVGTHCNVSVTTTPALREICLGIVEGSLKKDLLITNPMFLMRLSSSDPRYDHIGFEKGETKREAKARIVIWLKTYLETTSYTRIGICSHNRILQLLLIELGYDQEHIGNAEFIEIKL